MFLELQMPWLQREPEIIAAYHDALLNQLHKEAPRHALDYLVRADIALHLARAHAARSAWWSTAQALRQSLQLLETGQERFPACSGLRKSQYPIRLFLGLAPERFHWIMDLLGLSPAAGYDQDLALGTHQALDTSWQGFFSLEYAWSMAFTQHFTGGSKSAILFWMNKATAQQAHLTLSQYGRFFLALETRRSYMLKYPSTHEDSAEAANPFPGLQRVRGRWHLYQGRYQRALKALITYQKLSQAPLDCSCLQWMYWAAQLVDPVGRSSNPWEALLLRTCQEEGSSQSRQIIVEHETFGNVPDPLLQARLALDAGYAQQARDQLWRGHAYWRSGAHPAHAFLGHYQMARAHQLLGHTDSAHIYYDTSINLGRKIDAQGYRLPAAYLYRGVVLMERGQREAARRSWRAMLRYEDYPFIDGLTRKALRQLEASEQSRQEGL